MPTTSGEFTCPHCKSKVSASITLPSSATSRPGKSVSVPTQTVTVNCTNRKCLKPFPVTIKFET